MGKLLLFISCITAVVADMMLVWYAKHKEASLLLFWTAFLINAAGIYVWQYSMRKGIESATAITVYCLLTTVGCTALGYFFFHEQLSIKQMTGILLAIISLCLITL